GGSSSDGSGGRSRSWSRSGTGAASWRATPAPTSTSSATGPTRAWASSSPCAWIGSPPPRSSAPWRRNETVGPLPPAPLPRVGEGGGWGVGGEVPEIPNTTRYVLKRLGFAALMLIEVSLILFTLMRLAPGGPEAVLIGGEFSQEVAARICHRLGLDRPLLV